MAVGAGHGEHGVLDLGVHRHGELIPGAADENLLDGLEVDVLIVPEAGEACHGQSQQEGQSADELLGSALIFGIGVFLFRFFGGSFRSALRHQRIPGDIFIIQKLGIVLGKGEGIGSFPGFRQDNACRGLMLNQILRLVQNAGEIVFRRLGRGGGLFCLRFLHQSFQRIHVQLHDRIIGQRLIKGQNRLGFFRSGSLILRF